MSTVNDIAVRVLQRLEEDPAAPVFWDLQNEVYPAVVEAINEAQLITGTIQLQQTDPITLVPNTTLFSMPQNSLALLRILGPWVVQKTSLYALDQLNPGWENDGGTEATSPVQQITKWFPLGTNMFGVYPKLSVEQQVTISYLAYPITASEPYSGTEEVLLQQEFQDAIEEYTAHILRLKEAGQEFELSQTNYSQFLDTMKSLSAFQSRHDSLVWSQSAGARVRVNDVGVR